MPRVSRVRVSVADGQDLRIGRAPAGHRRRPRPPRCARRGARVGEAALAGDVECHGRGAFPLPWRPHIGARAVSLQAPSLQVGGATRIELRSEHKPGNGACPCPQRQDDQVAAAFGGARAARSSVRARMRPRWIWASNAGTVAVPKNCAMVAKPRQTAHPLCHGRRLPLRKGESLPLRRRGAGHRGFPQLNKHMGAQAKPGPGMTRGGSGRWAECQSLCGLVQDLFLSRVPHCTAVRRFPNAMRLVENEITQPATQTPDGGVQAAFTGTNYT